MHDFNCVSSMLGYERIRGFFQSGPLVFDETVKHECSRERTEDKLMSFIGCSCFPPVWAPLAIVHRNKLCGSLTSVVIMSCECLNWMYGRKLTAIKHLEASIVNVSSPPSHQREVPPSLFSRFSSGLMKMEVFYGR